MQGLLSLTLLALLVLALTTASSAQEASEPQLEERQLTLTKELVEYLLGVLSPQCRYEMEQALESQQKGDLSDACRQEVVFLAQQHLQQQEGGGDPDLLQQQQQQKQQKQPRAKKGPVAAPSNVILTMVGFFALAIAAIAAAGFYINSRRGSWGQRRANKGTKHTKKEMLAALQKKK